MYEIDLFHAGDERGSFTKTFHRPSFEKEGLEGKFDESFFSVNKKGVVRGMHFQSPPHDHAKVVYASSGRILDVFLDIRKSSPTYGNYASIEISLENHKAVYMPKGIAHGFCCLTDATMVYLTTTVQNKESEGGIRWDSFGMPWPVEDIIVSERDRGFIEFKNFTSPFE